MQKGGWLAAFAAVLFVPLAVVALILFTTTYYLSQPSVYKQALIKQNIYEHFSGLAAEQLVYYFHQNPVVTENMTLSSTEPVSSATVNDLMPFLSRLSRSDWESILNELAPSDWVQTQTEGIFDQATAPEAQGKAESEIIVSMADVKERLVSEQGMNALLRLVAAQPLCEKPTTKQLIDFQGHSIPLCKPVTGSTKDMTPQYWWILRDISAQIPDEINVAKPLMDILPRGSQLVRLSEAAPVTPAGTLRWVRQGLLLSPLVPFGLLVLVMLLVVRTSQAFLRWWGGPLMASGLLGLALAAGLQPAMSWWAAEITFKKSSQYLTPDTVRVLVQTVEAIVQPLGSWIGMGALLLAALGAAMLATSIALSRRKGMDRRFS